MNNFAAAKAVVLYHGSEVMEIPAHQSRTRKVKATDGFTITAHTSDSQHLMVNNRDSIMLPAQTLEPFSVDISVPRTKVMDIKFIVAITNLLDKRVKVTMDGGLVTKHMVVDAKTRKKKFDVVSPLLVDKFTATAKEDGSQKIFSVNGQKYFDIRPTDGDRIQLQIQPRACSRQEIYRCQGYEGNKETYCSGQGPSKSDWFMKNCDFMCGYCNYKPECNRSDDKRCKRYLNQKERYCTKHRWLKTNCARMCGLCTQANSKRMYTVDEMSTD